jgi:hypothetical protein
MCSEGVEAPLVTMGSGDVKANTDSGVVVVNVTDEDTCSVMGFEGVKALVGSRDAKGVTDGEACSVMGFEGVEALVGSRDGK